MHLHAGPFTFAFLGALAVAALSCGDGGEPGPGGFAPAEGDCSGCFHVVRDLEFVRELAVIDDHLYVSDADGARLLRIELSTEAMHEVGEYVSAHYLFVSDGALYYMSADPGGEIYEIFKVSPASDTPSLVARYPRDTGTLLGVRDGVPHVLRRRNVVTSVGLEGPLVEKTYPAGANGLVMAPTGELGWIAADRSVEFEASADSGTKALTVDGTPSRLSFVAGQWYATGTSNEGRFVAWRLGSNDEPIATGGVEQGKIAGLIDGALLFLVNEPDMVSKVTSSGASVVLNGGDVGLEFGDQPVAVHGTDVFVGGYGRARGQVYLVRGKP